MSNRITKAESLTSAPILANPCYVQPFLSLHNEDCLETMGRIETGSVDLMLTDPPYNVTSIEWDNSINVPAMWAEWERILKPNGTWIFTANQPFASELIMSRLGFFKYELIWDKVNHSNPFVAPYRPLPVHENILIFSRGKTTYNPQKTFHGRVGKKSKNGKRLGEMFIHNGGDMKDYDGYGMPMTIQQFVKDSQNGMHSKEDMHPTQKPLKLFQWLVKTYSNENDLVFDGYSGSGTTAAACIKERRNFIGSELNKEYFDLSVKRLTEISMKPELELR